MIDAGKLSDAELDAAYAAAFDARIYRDAQLYSVEIVDRLASIRSFVTGLFGSTRFPLFDARGQFQQVAAARDAVNIAAQNITNKLSLWGGSLTIIAGLALVAFIIWKVKK